MIDALKEFFQSRLAPAPKASPEAAEKALRLAAGVLLFEVVRADHKIEESERTVMRASLQSTFGLGAEAGCAGSLFGEARVFRARRTGNAFG